MILLEKLDMHSSSPTSRGITQPASNKSPCTPAVLYAGNIWWVFLQGKGSDLCLRVASMHVYEKGKPMHPEDQSSFSFIKSC